MPATSAPSSRTRLLLLGGLAVAVFALLAFLLLGGGEDGDGAAAVVEAPSTPNTQAPTPEPSRPAAQPSSRAAGLVRASSGEVIAEAVVTLLPLGDDEREPMTARSDAGGQWSFDAVAPGRYALSATAPGFLAAVMPLLVLEAGGERSDLELRLSAGGHTLSGTVSDKTGGVIEGAMVQVTPQAGISSMREAESYFAMTDEQGRYALQLPEGRARVQASHVDYSTESLVLEIAASELVQDFMLVPTAVIEGVVVRDTDGAPVPGAEVSWARERMMMMPRGGRMSTFERGGRVVTDDAGRFRISHLPPGLVELSARASLLASVEATQVPVGIAEHIDGVELRLGAAVDVEGRVIAKHDGQGIGEAEVTLLSSLGSGLQAHSEADGRFTLRGLLPGSYRVVAEAEGWTTGQALPPTIEVAAEPSSIIVELERAAGIRGRVEPATAAEVGIELRPDSMALGSGMMMLRGANLASTDPESGAFTLSPVQPGRYTLEAHAPDGRGGSVEVEVGPEGADEVVIALEQRAILSGRVEDFSGRVQSDLSVRARKRRSGSSLSVIVNGRELTAQSSPTSTKGTFEIAGLAAGTWIVEVVDTQGDVLALDVGASLDVELGAGERRELVLRVEPRDGTISGVVRDAEGEVVADAWVSAAFVPKRPEPEAAPTGEGGHSTMKMVMISDDGSSTPRTLPPQLSDEQGRFAFTGLRRGEYILTAELDGGTNKATREGVQPNAEITLDLAPLGAIEGRVSTDGRAAANCIARISGPVQRRVRVRDGKFEVERLEAGTYTIEASTPEGSTSTSVEVQAGATASVELALTRLSEIRGTIIDEDGQPLAGVEILIGAGEGGRIEINREDGDPVIVTKEDGSFVAHAAAGGRILLAQQPGLPMPIVIKPFRVEGGENVDLGQLRRQKLEGKMMMEPGE